MITLENVALQGPKGRRDGDNHEAHLLARGDNRPGLVRRCPPFAPCHAGSDPEPMTPDPGSYAHLRRFRPLPPGDLNDSLPGHGLTMDRLGQGSGQIGTGGKLNVIRPLFNHASEDPSLLIPYGQTDGNDQ